MKKLLVLLMLLPSVCFGEMVLHLSAYHPTNEYLSNNVFGLGYKEDDTVTGVYYNSWENVSVYHVREKRLMSNVNFFIGGATGYSKVVIPITGVNIEIGEAILTITPPISDYAYTSVMFSVRVN